MKKKFKRLLSFILAIIVLSSAFTFSAVAEDNANSGSGSTGNAGKDMGYYSNGQFMWKVSLYVGNYDHLTTASSLSNFYLVGNQSVYIKPSSCTAYSSAKYGAYNKVQYLNGYSLALNSTPTIMPDTICPVPPVAYTSGNIDTVKAYFGNTSTMINILSTLATANGTSNYGLVSGLSFTISGVTKSGWSAEYLLPSSSMSNRVPWVIIYEPIVIGFLRDGSKVAFTATEYALAQINGWYNFCNRADNTALTPQYLQALTRNVLPASVKLEESWFGYGTYNSYTNEIWSDMSVVYYGGWGMRFLPNVIEENKYNYSIFKMSATEVTDGKTDITVMWYNKSQGYGWAECEVFLDGVRVVDEWIYVKVMSYQIKHYDNIPVYGTGTKTITARINWSKRAEEADPVDNSMSISITSAEIKPDFAVTSLSVVPGTVYQGNAAAISVTVKNLVTTRAYNNIPIVLTINGAVYKSVSYNFPAGGSYTYNFTIVMETLGTNTIAASINKDNMYKESSTGNNIRTTTATVNPYYDFSISDLTVAPMSCYQGETITVTCRTDNWDTYNAYTSIPVELLYNGKVLSTLYVDYPAYGAKTHSFVINVGAVTGTNTIEVRVNWGNRLNEANPNNNTDTTSNTVSAAVDLSIKPVTPNATYNEGTEVITSFYVYNNGGRNIIPSDFNSVVFQAYYYKTAAEKITITTTSKTEVVIPKSGNNLVYFKWKVPDNIAGKTVYFVATVNSSGIISESDRTNNTATLTQKIGSVAIMETPNTKFEANNGGWYASSVPSEVPGNNSWAEWVYINGVFVRKVYGVKLTETVTLTPDENCSTAWQEYGKWYMRSGYGYSLKCTSGIAMISSGYLLPDSSAYTMAQNGAVYFPEFNYKTDNGKYRTLELVDGSLQFYKNLYSKTDNRIHFTPIWFPNGSYTVSCKAYDCWTPAGMITTTGNGSIQIEGTMYDDYYYTN